MDRFQLGQFQLSRNPNSDDLLLLVSGPTLYKTVLARAFPTASFSRTFPDRFGRFDWGTYIRGADVARENTLRQFCQILQRVILIDDDLDETYALAFHRQMSTVGAGERTPIGQLVREAKPYDQAGSPGDRVKAVSLAARMAELVREHPTYRQAELLLAVPPSNPNKAFDLPTLLAEEIARLTGQGVATAGLKKVRDTRPMKACRTIKEKIDNLTGAFGADPAVFGGRSVIIVDDIYETGFSLNEVGRTVRQANATLVVGLAATKTVRDLGEQQDLDGADDVIPF